MPLLASSRLAKSGPPAEQVAPSPRLRKAAIVDAAESPERKAHGGVEFVVPCEWKSVMHLEIHSLKTNGAAHRKKD